MISIWGANGFLGSHIARALKQDFEQGNILYCARQFDNALIKDVPPTQKQIIDFEKPDSYADIMRQSDSLILSISGISARSSAAQCEQDIQNHRQFIEALKPYENKHLVYLSSGGAVYGVSSEQQKITEDAPLHPVSAYGTAKKEIERLIINSGISYTILRVANPVGIDPKEKGIVYAVLKAIKEGRSVEIFGDGSVIRDYFAADDLGAAVCACIENDAAKNGVFNIGSGSGLSIHQLAGLIGETVGAQANCIYSEADANDVPFNILDCSKAQNILGWTTKRDIREVILDIWKTL